MGGGFGSKNGAGDYTYIAADLARDRTGLRSARSPAARRASIRATATPRCSGSRRRPLGRNADGARGRVRERDRLGRLALVDRRPMEMLYGCENVRIAEYGAKLNTGPMKAFRAPGFVEGTFGLECLIDELAAKLDLDPLEFRRRNHSDHDAVDGRPFSSKNLLEYRRAQPHWDRRDEVRGRSEGAWKRGVGMASQIWYGGGGLPSYAWVRIGADARAVVITAMQDIGTGTATAMAQIAAEELGLPLDRVDVSLGDSARGPTRASPPAPPRFRRWARRCGRRPRTPPRAARDRRAALRPRAAHARLKVEHRLGRRRFLAARGGHRPPRRRPDPRQGSRGPNPTGMRVLTFGVQVAEVAVDVETGEVRVERIAAIHDVGRHQPTGHRARSRAGSSRASGHTLSEERLLDPRTGSVLTPTLDAYKLPTIADVPEIVTDLVDVPDQHLTNLGSKGSASPDVGGDRERHSRRDGGRRPLLPITREEMLRALREARERSPERVELLRPDSVETATSALDNGAVALAGGTELVLLMREGIVEADRLVQISGVVPRGIREGWVGGGTTLGELEVDPQIPAALREASMLAASPQLRAMGTIAGNLLQATRCWYWRLQFPCRLHGGDRCFAREDSTASMRSSRTTSAPSAHPSDPAAALLALSTTVVTDRRRLPLADLYRLPNQEDRRTTTLEDAELIRFEYEPPLASTYLKRWTGGATRSRWSASRPRGTRAGRGWGSRVSRRSRGRSKAKPPSRRRHRCRVTPTRSSSPDARSTGAGGRRLRWPCSWRREWRRWLDAGAANPRSATSPSSIRPRDGDRAPGER